MEKSYRPLDHTGDLGVEVWGRSREELLGNASKALTDTIADVEKIPPEIPMEWLLSAGTPEGLLVRQLQEILYQLDAKGLVFSDFKIQLTGLSSLKCVARGVPFSREKHGFKTEIKAITYHHLKIWQEGGGWRARIIFDV